MQVITQNHGQWRDNLDLTPLKDLGMGQILQNLYCVTTDYDCLKPRNLKDITSALNENKDQEECDNFFLCQICKGFFFMFQSHWFPPHRFSPCCALCLPSQPGEGVNLSHRRPPFCKAFSYPQDQCSSLLPGTSVRVRCHLSWLCTDLPSWLDEEHLQDRRLLYSPIV